METKGSLLWKTAWARQVGGLRCWRHGERSGKGFCGFSSCRSRVAGVAGLGSGSEVDQGRGGSQRAVGDVWVNFTVEFPEFELQDFQKDLAEFAEVFADSVRNIRADYTDVKIEMLKGSFPPLVLKGRAYSTRVGSSIASRTHTDAVLGFVRELEKVKVQKEISAGIRRTDLFDPGTFKLDFGPATIEQDVKVVMPQKKDESFFQKHPEVLVTAVVIVSLLFGILVALCAWILRDKGHPQNTLESLGVDRSILGTRTVLTGRRSNRNQTSSAPRNEPTVPDPKNISQLASKNRVEFETLEFIEKIGKGSFKTVFRGRWGSNSVAIVRMRRGGVLVEARLMQKLSLHPNVVNFYRWTRDREGNEYIVMELLPLGSLDVVLRRPQNKMRIKSKIAMCAQICQAMCQLADEKVLHRDLAVRNVLVQSLDPVIVKVSDFGLAKYVSPSLSNASNILQHLPVRWIPPEVMLKQEWSEKSDVWAFGVTMWEVFSNSREPYAAEFPSDEDVVKHVLNGGRLTKPENCPEVMYHMMLECWHVKPCDRPDFQELSRRFKAPAVAATVQLDSGSRTWGGSARSSSPGESVDTQPGPSNLPGDQHPVDSSGTEAVNIGSVTNDSVASLPPHEDSYYSIRGLKCQESDIPDKQMGSEYYRRVRHRNRVSSGMKCSSISSIPDPEFQIESDQDDAFAERGTHPLLHGRSLSNLGRACQDLLPVEIESPSTMDCGPSFETHVTIEASRGMRAREPQIELSPYTDIGDVVG